MKKLLLAGVSASVLALTAGAALADTEITASVNDDSDAIYDNTVYDGNPDLNREATERDNEISDSFDSLTGIHQIQQNNGSANRILTGTAVGVDLDDPGDTTVDASTYGAVEDNTIIIGNSARTQGDEDRDNAIDTDSFDDMAGVVTVQQNNGDVNDMGVANAIATVAGDGSDEVFQYATTNGYVDSNVGNSPIVDPGLTVLNEIDDAFEDGAGVANVQQNNGAANVIGIANAIAVYDGTDADLSGDDPNVTQEVSTYGNIDDVETQDNGSTRDNAVTDSFNGFEGVATVQQNNGNSNVLGSALAVAAFNEENGDDRDVMQTVSAEAYVTDNDGSGDDVFDSGSDRTNTIDPAFDDFAGVATVQQNNGDGNVLGAATGVVANFPDSDSLDDYDQYVSTYGVIDDIEMTTDSRDGVFGDRDNLIEDSFDSAAGVLTVQQNNGSANAVLSAIAVAVDASGDTGGGEEDVDIQYVSTYGDVVGPDSIEQSSAVNDDADRRNDIVSDSFDQAEGVITVQQNNGDANVLGSAIGVAASIAGSDDIDDVEDQDVYTEGYVSLGSNDEVIDVSSNRENVISDSFEDARGVFSVGQNNGNANVIGSAIGVAASIDPDGNNGDEVFNSSDVYGSVTGSSGSLVSTVDPADRTNTIDDSFVDAEGVGTVYQNNGDANVIGSAIAVAAHGGANGFDEAVSTATLNGVVTDNTINVFSNSPIGTEFTNTISNGAFDGASGVLNIIQNNGNGNVIGAATTVTANF